MATARFLRPAAAGTALVALLALSPSVGLAHGGRCDPARWPGAANLPDDAPPLPPPSPAAPAPERPGPELVFVPSKAQPAALARWVATPSVAARLDDPAPAPAVPAPAPAPAPPPAVEAPPTSSPAASPPPPPPPAPTTGAAASSVAPAAPPPAARPRPEEPPPPDPEIRDGDVDHRNRSVPLGPPIPPLDPFAPRDLVFRHEREISTDGRIVELRHVPQWADVIDKRELEEGRPFSIGELARRLPNVAMADGGSPFLTVPVVRGLSGDRVKILTDGVWPTSQALGVAGGTLSLWDAESTERVEILHGPGASLRGADAIGGVINVVPIRPHRHACLEAWGRFASAWNSADQRFRERGQVEVGAGRLAALAGVTYEDHGHRETPDGTLDPSTYEFWAGDLAVDYFLDNQTTVGFTGQHVRALDIRSPLASGDAYTQPRYERTFLAGTISSFGGGGVFKGTRLSFSFDNFLQQDDQQTNLSTTDGISSEDDVSRFDLRLQGNLYLWDCHDTWAELSVSYAHLDRTESILCTTQIGIDQRVPFLPREFRIIPLADPGVCVAGEASFEAEEWRVKALFEDEWHDGCWDFQLGGRIDWYHLEDNRTGEKTDDILWGAAGGVVRRLSKCWSVYGNASYSQRHPSIDERLSVSILNGITVFPDPDLDVETSIAGEIGLRGTRWNHYTWQVAGFVNRLGDYIGQEPILTDAVWANRGDVTLYGGETTASWRLAPCACEGLEAFGSAGVTFSDDDEIVRPMPLTGRLGARWSNCLGCPESCGFRRWFVEGSFRGGLDQGFAPSDSGDGYVTAELLAGVGFGFGDRRRAVQATIGVTNLFDEEYTELYARLPAMGRSLVLSVQFDF